MYIRDLIFVTLSIGEEGWRGVLGAMAAAAVAAYIVLFSPYNIDLQRCDVASARGRNLSARSTRRKIFWSSIIPLQYNTV